MNATYQVARKASGKLAQRANGRETSGICRMRVFPLVASCILWICVRTSFAQYTMLHLPPGYVQIQGDIITQQTNAARLLADLRGWEQGPQLNFIYAPSRLWPNRTVPYDFDSGVSSAQRAVFVAAMNAWANSFPGATTISFQPRNGESIYLHLAVGDPGGFSGGSTDYVGSNGGKVTITVSSDAVFT